MGISSIKLFSHVACPKLRKPQEVIANSLSCDTVSFGSREANLKPESLANKIIYKVNKGKDIFDDLNKLNDDGLYKVLTFNNGKVMKMALFKNDKKKTAFSEILEVLKTSSRAIEILKQPITRYTRQTNILAEMKSLNMMEFFDDIFRVTNKAS